jgi:DNA gyrase/topoisomerase IV subunit A
MRFLRRHPPNAQQISRDLIHRFDLKEPQAGNVTKIMESSFKKIENLRKENFAELQLELEKLKKNISLELNEEQKKRWKFECRHLDHMLPPTPEKSLPPLPSHK